MFVHIKMHENAGVHGEDRKDWLGGEVHECSLGFARHLVTRGLASIIEPAAAIANRGGAVIEHGDPAIETRDPAPMKKSGLTTASLDGPEEEGLDTADDAPLVRPPSPRKHPSALDANKKHRG